MDGAIGSLPPYPGPLVFLAWWAPWVQDQPLGSSPLLQPFHSIDFLTIVEGGLLCLGTQPHRSFHDIVSEGGRDIKGPGITSYQGSECI